MAKIYGQLEKAQAENTTSDTASHPKGMITYRTDLNLMKVSNGTAYKAIIDEDTAQTLSTKTLASPSITGATTYNQITTPSNPASGFNKIYFKADGKAYTLDSNGVEQALGSGSGSGINYITNPDGNSATTGWSTYANAAAVTPSTGTGGSPNVTWTVTTSSPLRGAGSFLFTKDAANRQGQGVSYDFTIDSSDKTKVLQGSFEYAIASGTFADDDLQLWVYDVTNATLIPVTPYKLKNHTTAAEKFGFEFQTTTSTSYRLIIHVASTSASAYTVKMDNFAVGPTAKLYGSPISDWVSYSPVVGAVTTAPTYGTVAHNVAYYRRVGDSLEITWSFRQTTAGTGGSGAYLLPLPSGLSVDSSKIKTPAAGYISPYVGEGYIATSSGEGKLHLSAYSTTQLEATVTNATNDGTVWSSTFFAFGNAVVDFSIKAKVPILGWGSTAIMSQDASTRVVAARYTSTAGQSIPNSTNTDLIFATKDYDTHNAMNTSTGEYTVQVPGKYRVNTRWTFANATTFGAGEQIYLGVYKNGTLHTRILHAFSGSPGGSETGQEIYASIDCKAGDVIKTQGFQSSGGSLSLLTSGADVNTTIEMIQGPAQVLASEKIVIQYENTAGTSFSTGTETILPFATKLVDTHGAFSTSTNLFTAPISGFYRFSCNFNTSFSGGTNPSSLELRAKKNGSNCLRTYIPLFSTGGVAIGACATDTIQLNAGDTIGFYIRNDVGTSVSAGTATGFTRMSIESV